MKFCVMMTAQGDAVARIDAEVRKENDGQNVVSLQVVPPAATPAGSVAGSYRFGPFSARPAMSERLFDAAIHVIRVVLAGVQYREDSGLSFPPFAGFRAVRAVACPVLACFVDSAAYLARNLLRLRVGQRSVDDIQSAFVSTDGPDVSAKILACLKVGAENAARFGYHAFVRLFARLTAEPSGDRMPSAPTAVLFDHRSIILRYGSTTL